MKYLNIDNYQFKTIMIRIKDHSVSEAYANHCAKSWKNFNLKMYDAITPETLHLESGLTFGKRGDGHGGERDLTDTEKACFYSQYNLWKKSVIENVPILILEHDAWLEKPNVIQFNPHLEVQYFGQHAMEAVMFHPKFAKRLINHCTTHPIKGPMTLVDGLLGFSRKKQQSRYALPHARYMGMNAPVKSIIDPNLGATVDHTFFTSERLKTKDRDLFKIVNINNDTQ